MNSFFINVFYLFFEGVLLFQALFYCLAFLITKRKDALYYSLLNFISAVYFLLNESGTFGIQKESFLFKQSYFEPLNFALLLSLFYLYTLFLKEIFIETLEKYSYVKKLYKTTVIGIYLIFSVFVLLTMMGWNTNIIFYAGHIVNSPFCIAIMLLNLKAKSYKSLIIYAMYVSFICLLATIIFTIRSNEGNRDTLLDQYPMALIKVSMLFDIILFQLALLKSWNEREKKIATEKIGAQLAVEKLRNQISGELHDDIGSTLSGVSIYSHLTEKQMFSGEYDKARASLKIIQESTNEIVDKLGDLVWAVKPKQESLEFLLGRIKQFAVKMCASKNIAFIHSLPAINGQFGLSQEHLHHLYLILKEAVNNAVKYSFATELTLQITVNHESITLSVNDNGKGFEINSITRGNGLNGMQKRASEIGAILNINSKPGVGTNISIMLLRSFTQK